MNLYTSSRIYTP